MSFWDQVLHPQNYSGWWNSLNPVGWVGSINRFLDPNIDKFSGQTYGPQQPQGGSTASRVAAGTPGPWFDPTGGAGAQPQSGLAPFLSQFQQLQQALGGSDPTGAYNAGVDAINRAFAQANADTQARENTAMGSLGTYSGSGKGSQKQTYKQGSQQVAQTGNDVGSILAGLNLPVSAAAAGFSPGKEGAPFQQALSQMNQSYQNEIPYLNAGTQQYFARQQQDTDTQRAQALTDLAKQYQSDKQNQIGSFLQALPTLAAIQQQQQQTGLLPNMTPAQERAYFQAHAQFNIQNSAQRGAFIDQYLPGYREQLLGRKDYQSTFNSVVDAYGKQDMKTILALGKKDPGMVSYILYQLQSTAPQQKAASSSSSGG